MGYPLAYRRVRFLPALLVSALVPLQGCSASAESTLERVQREDFVRAAYAHEPPYAVLDSTGRVVGESPAALRGALPALEVDSVRWVRMPFEELIPALAQGNVDVVASGLFPSATRREEADFTRPTSCSRAAFLVRADGPAPEGLEAFLEGDEKELGPVAVVRGSVEHTAVSILGLPEERVLVVPDLPTGVTALAGGRAGALALTAPTIQGSQDALEGLRWYRYTPSDSIADLVEGCSALAVRRGDEELLAALDRGLEAFVGSAGHRAALEPFGFSAEDVPEGSEP
ncbi:MAG: transporter substrate-binding domain-containing protein [Gemmatimonadota bacterium]|nr:transporter substrate-binding domain-containing protein [Gemmatimonadota bacterium]